MAERTVTYTVAAKDNASLVFQRVGENLKKLQAQSGAGGFAAQMKQQGASLGIAGETSIIGLMRGGGALIGVMAVTNAFKGLAEAIGQYQEAAAKGEQTTGDLAANLLASLPVVGQLGQAIYDLASRLKDLSAGMKVSIGGVVYTWSKSARTIVKEGENAAKVLENLRDLTGKGRWGALEATFGKDPLNAFDIAEAKKRQAFEKELVEATAKASRLTGAERAEATRELEKMQGWEKMRRRAVGLDREALEFEEGRRRMAEVPTETRLRLMREARKDVWKQVQGTGLGIAQGVNLGMLGPKGVELMQQLEITEKYKALRAPLEAVLKDPNLTKGQEMRVKSLLSGLTGLEGIEREKGGKRIYSANAPTEQARFLSGIGAAGNTAEARSVEALALTKQQRDIMEKIYQVLLQNSQNTSGIFYP